MKIDARSLVRAWSLARDAGRSLFTPGVGDELPTLPGWTSVGLPSSGLAKELTPARDERRRVHGKVLVIDRHVALLGSANFSASGLGANLEFGVRVEGAVAREVHRTVETLREEAWLVPVRGAG